MTRWGIVATIKAPAAETVAWAAHHLDLGADRLFIYLDERNDAAQQVLATHPRITVQRTNQSYWKSTLGKRPPKHQPRQTANATHAYTRIADLDWLMHMDVDEFLLSDTPIADRLRALSDRDNVARIRPIEALSADGQPDAEPGVIWFKGWIPAKGDRQEIVEALYPRFGRYVKGGFLSHLAGKIFLRTGLPGITFKIHNAFAQDRQLPTDAELAGIDLAHVHVTGWKDWRDRLDYRHEKGAYRAEMRPALPPEKGGLPIYDLLHMLRDEGEEALRAFFDEICVARPELRAGLQERGLLHRHRLDLTVKVRKHFPNFQRNVAE